MSLQDLRNLLIIASILAPGKLKLIFLLAIAIWNYWTYRSIKSWQLWGLFLLSGLISTIAAPYPLESFWGHPQLNDGWIFWAIVAAVAVTNRGETEDLMAIRFGASINFLLWICGTEPVAHRGHISAIMTIAFAQYPYVGIAAGLVTWNRSALAAVTLINWTKLGWKICAGAAAVVILFSSQKQIPGNFIDRVSSGRAHQIQLGIKAIQQRPLFGWGWEGYSQSYPFVGWAKDYKPQYYGFNWFRAGKKRQWHASSTAKIHFWLLDTMSSVGIAGTLILLKIMIASMTETPYKKEIWAYLFWVITWFDAADYTGVFWVLASSQQKQDKEYDSNEL